MTDAENSDDERYANESFENESDTEIPEMSEFESETTENSDDDENLPSVKANTGPIKRNSHWDDKTDVVPFDSSSEEDDNMVVVQTLVEINTPSMLFEETSKTSVSHAVSFDEDGESSEEIADEEDEDEEELKRIKEMEEKYLQQLSAETKEIHMERTENLTENQQMDTDESQEDNDDDSHSHSDDENDTEVTIKYGKGQESDIDDGNENVSLHGYLQKKTEKEDKYEDSFSSERQRDYKDGALEATDQTKLVQIIQTSLTNLAIASSKDNEEHPNATFLTQKTTTIPTESSNVINSEQIALAVVNALKSAGLNNLDKSRIPLSKAEMNVRECCEKSTNECHDRKDLKKTETEVVCYKDDFEEEKEVEVEKINKGNGQEIYCDGHFDYRITSKTPTSFNSDDYIFHANFIKPFYRTNSTDKLRSKPNTRKSMSFSNERMREIDRHNQILLRKILTQKPTYSLKSKSSQSSLQKLPSQTNERPSTSALNRKKQQRQIDFDNQVLKRKIEAIALRRSPFLS